MLNENRRIYSLNIAAYLIYNDFEDYTINKDEDNGSLYFIFNQNVKEIIDEYRTSEVYVNLKSYTGIFKRLKKEMHEVEI